MEEKTPSSNYVEEEPFEIDWEIQEQDSTHVTCSGILQNSSFRSIVVMSFEFERTRDNNYLCVSSSTIEHTTNALAPITRYHSNDMMDGGLYPIKELLPNAKVDFDENAQTCSITDKITSFYPDDQNWLFENNGEQTITFSCEKNGWVVSNSTMVDDYTSPLVDQTYYDESSSIKLVELDANEGSGSDGASIAGTMRLLFTWESKVIDASLPTGGTSRLLDAARSTETVEASAFYSGDFDVVVKGGIVQGVFELSVELETASENVPVSLSGTFEDGKSISLGWNKDGLLFMATYDISSLTDSPENENTPIVLYMPSESTVISFYLDETEWMIGERPVENGAYSETMGGQQLTRGTVVDSETLLDQEGAQYSVEFTDEGMKLTCISGATLITPYIEGVYIRDESYVIAQII